MLEHRDALRVLQVLVQAQARPALAQDARQGRLARLRAAIDIVRKHRERWREFEALVVERGWDAAAMVAVYDCQTRSMRLRWWELPPCVAGTRGKDRAARLLRRMLRRRISRWHPRPLQALAEAGPPVR